MALTKGQRAYTERFITVESTDQGLRVLDVTSNSLMATRRQKIIATAKSYGEAALIAKGFAKDDIRLSRSVQEILDDPILMRMA
jgi:hypothetical protein